MSYELLGIIGIVTVILLIFLRMHIAFAMAFVGFLGIVCVVGTQGALSILGRVPYTTLSYEQTVIPLFILMGELAYHSGIAKGLYNLASKWFGQYRGGVAMTTIAACAGFAAISATSIGSAAAMGVIALPEMRRFKYDPSLATGCLAAGGTLGILIPPSMGFVFYGIITETSIGRLFIAGILPGILLTTLFILTIAVQCRRNPLLGPPCPQTNFKEKFLAFRGVWETLILFLLVMGGIYGGLFTPMEAGGVGAFGALVIGLVKRKITWNNMSKSLYDTLKLTTMVLAILIGAFTFGYFMTLCGLPMLVATAVSESGLPIYVILLVIIIIYLILGCIMEFVSIMFLTLPIIYPTILALGFDPIWWGVIMVILLEAAQITPPIGINVFTIHGVAPDIPLSTIFRGIWPFFGAMVVCIIILIIFPDIAMVLPNMMMGRG